MQAQKLKFKHPFLEILHYRIVKLLGAGLSKFWMLNEDNDIGCMADLLGINPEAFGRLMDDSELNKARFASWSKLLHVPMELRNYHISSKTGSAPVTKTWIRFLDVPAVTGDRPSRGGVEAKDGAVQYTPNHTGRDKMYQNYKKIVRRLNFDYSKLNDVPMQHQPPPFVATTPPSDEPMIVDELDDEISDMGVDSVGNSCKYDDFF